jgi:hypothetical protein
VTPTDSGRGGRSAHANVCSPFFKTDPKSHWQDYGQKWFPMQRKQWLVEDATARLGMRAVREPIGEARARLIAECAQWAHEKYGLPAEGWERDPFGDYHPPGTMAALDAWLQERGV